MQAVRLTRTLLAIALFSLLAVPLSARADTYQLFVIGSDNGYNFVGMDDIGHAVTVFPGGSPLGGLYHVYTYGVETAIIASATPPIFNYDSAADPFDPIPATIYPAHDVGSLIYKNSIGDIVFNDPVNEDWLFAEDLTSHAPEPSSIILLGVGLLSTIGMVRRKRV